MSRVYPTARDALDAHHDQIERFGGSHGVRDHGQLEAAIFRPQTGYYSDLLAEAAALWESLSQNHPFIDGNKRTAFAVTHAFLMINGTELTADSAQVEEFLLGLYRDNALTFDALDAWLRRNTRVV